MKFNLVHASSSLLLLNSLLLFDNKVHSIYKLSCFLLFISSFIHHGYMGKKDTEHYCNIFNKKLKCSQVLIEYKIIKCLKILDWFFVSFVCFYTVANDVLNTEYICLICFMCVIISNYTHYLLLFVSNILVIFKFTLVLNIILFISLTFGLLFYFKNPKGFWANEYRYIWHLSCAINIYLGSLINIY